MCVYVMCGCECLCVYIYVHVCVSVCVIVYARMSVCIVLLHPRMDVYMSVYTKCPLVTHSPKLRFKHVFITHPATQKSAKQNAWLTSSI